ncbi:glycosyltransferase family 2 protein [Saccharicrinis aurantiacus]|uniref:glycosyltransferase family 2 protein n=1 Tax=Saccharicrinis aurantiacus TaxID=1849719 RepID=UPI0008381DC1|nr:glycosyltransferase family A protein [Saccharicrinis aurantiacus]
MVEKLYLFSFIKYVQPTWYFNLKSQADYSYWVDYNCLSEEQKTIINYDDSYVLEDSSYRDAAYQAWHKGIISISQTESITIVGEIPLEDEYRFIKKYYSQFWSFFILIIRLISLKNPWLEVQSFLKSRNIQREQIYASTLYVEAKVRMSNSLIEKEPLVSVIIPTLNRYTYLKDVLKDLESQDYKNIEVLICDQSDPIEEGFYKGWNLNLKLYKQEEKALWLARNKCIKESKGDFLLFYDDDSLVESDWVSNHLRCIDYFKVPISSGVSLSKVGGVIPTNYSFFRWSDQIDTGNVMISRSVFNQTGLFDRQFEKMRMGDGEFGLRCYTLGIPNVSNPLASRIHLKVSTGGLRHMGAWDAFRSRKFLAPLPIPSVLYFTRSYFGSKVALYSIMKTLPLSVMPYRFKQSNLMSMFGLLLFVLLLPKYIYQVVKSWRIASKMLIKGPKIEVYDL